MINLCKNIAKLRKEKKISQAELANYLNISSQSVSRWELGKTAPDIELLPDIAIFFGVPIEQLYGITNLQKIEQLVQKYSILRDELSYDQAMNAIKLEAGNAELQDNSEMIRKLKCLELHLYIQKEREMVKQSEAVIKDILLGLDKGDDDYDMLQMQKVQIEVLMGKGREMLPKARLEFMNKPSVENLQIYLNMLYEMYQDEEILNILENNTAIKILNTNSKQTAWMWELILGTAYYKHKIEYFDKFVTNSLDDFPLKSKVSILIMFVKLLKENGRLREAAEYRERLLKDLAEEKDYFSHQVYQQVTEM